MTPHPLAGTRAIRSLLPDVALLRSDYAARHPNASDPSQRVRFGTSGHRGSSLNGAFNEAHVLAITQAICDHRRRQGISGPLFLGRDTHALSEPAFETALEVLIGNGVTVMIDDGDHFTPTPIISHAILTHNRHRISGLADGIIISPSHNPPEDGGLKYNPPTGGPAETTLTTWIETRANDLLPYTPSITRVTQTRARETAIAYDYTGRYVRDLEGVVDVDAITHAGFKIGVDPLGGASVTCWHTIADWLGLDIEVVNDRVDPSFWFLPLDRDGRIRMDCSSPFAMAGMVGLKDRYDIAFGNDPDADCHGIVTRTGLMNPNHYLTVAVSYLYTNRPNWRPFAAIGKTIVATGLIDRLATRLGRTVLEMPVGFKWFVPGLLEGSLGFGGEERGAASFVRHDGTVWTTDRDGIVMNLLAVELMARTGRDPSEIYAELIEQLGEPTYERTDATASTEVMQALTRLDASAVSAKELAGHRIDGVFDEAPGNGAPIGGLKVTTAQGWFAARPSGTEQVYKLNAESFLGPDHLRQIQEEAMAIVDAAVK
jgi:phosphoglucomutase